MTQAGYIQLIADSSSLPKAEKDLDNLAKTSERTERRVKPSMESVSGSIDRVGMSSGQHTMAMRNLAFQLNQIGQQGAVTGNYLGALAIQIPDILSSFGSLPLVLAGGAIAVGASLVPSLIHGSDAAGDLEDALNDLDAITTEYARTVEMASSSNARLTVMFGENAASAREVYAAMAQLQRLEAFQSLANASTQINDALGPVETAVQRLNNQLDVMNQQNFYGAAASTARLREEFGMTVPEAEEVVRLMQELREAAPEDIGQAAQSLANQLMMARDASGQMPDEIRATAQQLYQVVLQWQAITDASEGESEATRQRRVDAQAMIAERQAEAALLQVITQYGENSAEAEAVRREQAMAATETYIQQNQLTGSLADNLRVATANLFDAETGARAAAASLSEAEQAARALASAMAAAAGFSVGIEGQIATVRAQLDALRSGQDATTAGRVESLRQEAAARRDAVVAAAGADDAARVAAEERYQADLQSIDVLGQEMTALREMQQVQRQGATTSRREHNEAMREAERVIESIRTETEQYKVELADLNELFRDGYLDAEQYKRAVQMVHEEYSGLTELQDQLKDAILDFADGGEDAMENLARAIRRAALEALLFGEGPLAQFFGGGGGLFGGLASLVTGGRVKSFDGGGYTGSGPRLGGIDGKGGFLSVMHPNETVIDHTKGGSGSGGTLDAHITVSVDENGNLQAFVDKRASRALQAARPGMIRDSVSATRASVREFPLR